MSRPARLPPATERNILVAIQDALASGEDGVTLTWEPKKAAPGEILVRAKPFREGRMVRCDPKT